MLSRRSTSAFHPFDLIQDILCLVDADGRFTFINTFAQTRLNIKEEDFLGKTYEEVRPSNVSPEVLDAFYQALRAQERTEFITFNASSSVRLHVVLSPHHGGLVIHVRPLLNTTPTYTDLSRDILTGCLTREALKRLQPSLGLPQVLAVIDLNRLKAVNTLRGHRASSSRARSTGAKRTARSSSCCGPSGSRTSLATARSGCSATAAWWVRWTWY